MEAINQVASTLNSSIDAATEYFKANALPILCLVAAVLYLRRNSLNGKCVIHTYNIWFVHVLYTL